MLREWKWNGRRLGWVVLVLAALGHHSTAGTTLAAPEATARQVAVLGDSLPGMDPATTEAVGAALRREGFKVVFLTAEQVCDPKTLSAARFFLYVIPSPQCYPANGAEALASYLKARGNLLILGTPLSEPLWRLGDLWLDRSGMREVIARVKPDRIVYDFDDGRRPAAWTRSNRRATHCVAEVVPGGAEGSAGCLQVTMDYQDGQPNGWGGPLDPNATPASGGLLSFWAKGDGRTPRVNVRLFEGPGPQDRGIAVVSLTKEWKHYVLRAEDFGVLGRADPYRAKRVSFELVNSQITPDVPDGRHTFWVDRIGTAPNPLAVLGDPDRSPFPILETISPGYKTYPLKDIAAIGVEPAQGIVGAKGLKLPVPVSAASCYARPEGKGLERGYSWRWIPLARAYDREGIERGTPIWMTMVRPALDEGPAFNDAVRRLREHRNTPKAPSFDGAVCAVCAIRDHAALQQMARTELFGAVARRIHDGLFLSHAGSGQFSYWPGEPVELGGVAVNQGQHPAEVEVRARVCPKGAKDAEGPVFEARATVTIEPGQSAKKAFRWTPGQFDAPSYRVTTELLRGGRTIDVIAHELGVLCDKKPASGDYITVHDGDFWLHGKPWYPVGVNYWPRYAIALECEDYVYHWLTPGFYNPEEVERDLVQMESMGLNFVAIRANVKNDRRTLLDFLRRCRNHDIYVFLFVQTHVITDEPHYFQGIMMPQHFQEEASADFIRACRLPDNPALMAYDLIWEPAGWLFGDQVRMFGWSESEPYRRRWDNDWARWIENRYGSLAAAEKDWGMPAPRRDGRVTSPSSTQFQEDGPWRILVAAYRRFMDDLMSRKWNDATQKLRRMDPNHLISFRQGNLSSIDFTLTATPKHVDFFCMEGYSFRPGGTGPNVAGFVNRYLHFATGGKPHLWIEFGGDAWNKAAMQPGEREMASQTESHALIHRAALQTGAKGTVPWWWAGGYRVSEKSDYGILNPDGTLRPSGRLLQQYAKQFQTPRAYPKSDTWFTVDRDAQAGSHWWIAFNTGAEAYRKAEADGKQLGIRSPATGTTSADTPLLAVGNTPYNGYNPPKYLNAEFNRFRIRIGDAPWIEVTNGARIRVPRNRPIVASASAGNLQEATWLTPGHCQGKPGAVYLASTADSQLRFKQPITKNTARLEDADFGTTLSLTEGVSATTNVVLQMTAEDRAWFGEKLQFTLEPVE